MNEAYAAAADDAIAEAERVRDRWFAAGDTRAALAKRLIGFLVEQRDDARDGKLPPRDGNGFALTRFVSDYEWRPEGAELADRVYAMQRIWLHSK